MTNYCLNFDGTGEIKYISHQTEEYVEHEKDECPECKGIMYLEKEVSNEK